MRFVTFMHSSGPRVGLVSGDEIVELHSYDHALPTDLAALLALGRDTWTRIVQRAQAGTARRVPLAGTRLCAPVATPSKVFGIGMNFSSFLSAAQHRGMMATPGQRIWFNRQPRCVAGPADDILMPHTSKALDFEGELAIVIGSRCRHLSAAQARDAIAGYTICNDLTVRDWAARCPLLGKSFDTHAPMGPWLVTADEIDDPHSLTITTTVNGERRQHGSTREMLTDCYALVAELSAITTLEPGDVILTGTPDGCGALSDPPRFLCEGDCVRVCIEGIGEIANTVVPELVTQLPEPVDG
ncbi:fumarylacetoacetate hydrolase family protein [Paraburkholderia sp. PREW-6R]|uniref:fumarylacetoacetate hydrolase family protein n=1 Tax=Paraburkholderia sp. PREW-6R TaxID=3141544 RepID=UPI0031F5206A